MTAAAKMAAYCSSQREARISFWLFAAGAAGGVFQLYYPYGSGPHEIEFGAGFEMLAIARNLADHGAFANPFLADKTGPTAVVPPIYPLVLAALTWLLRDPGLVALAAVIGSISVNALVASWLPRISFLFYGDGIPGIIAAVLWLLTAPLMPSWDTSYTVAGLLLVCLLSASSQRAAGWTIVGFTAGVVSLLNPASILVSAPWAVYLLALQKLPWKRTVKHGCALLGSSMLVVSLWALRNYHALGSPVLRTNMGMTLYASNNPCAESSLIDNARDGCYQAHHPNHSIEEARLLQAMGEVAYDRQRVADAKRWISANPDRFRELTLRRFREFWFPIPGNRAYMTYIIWIATLLSIPGLILMAKRPEPVTLFVAAVLLIYPLMYYLVVTDVRYRYPVLWLSLLPAGYFTLAVARLVLRSARREDINRRHTEVHDQGYVRVKITDKSSE